MGHQAKKTDHVGAKHGSGAYWGPKQDAKKESNKLRRRVSRDLTIAEEWFDLDEEAWQRAGDQKAHTSGKVQVKKRQ